MVTAVFDEHAWAAIRTALESAGVILIDQNGDEPGVRLKKGGGGAGHA
jgi:hypothetical protein